MNVNYSFPDFIINNKKNINTIVIVVVLYLFFLVINLPANIVLSLFALPDNVKFTSVTGTVWSGKVNKLNYAGIDLGSVKWELHPLHLIFGELNADISFVNRKQYIQSEISLSPSGKIELKETRFSIDLSALQPLTYGMPFSYAGEASGYFPVSHFHKNKYVGINGKLSLNNIQMISPQQQSFGDFLIDFHAEKEGATSGDIKDNSDVLELSGRILLNKKGKLNLSAKLAANEAGSSLERVISFLGPKDAAGRVQLNSVLSLWY